MKLERFEMLLPTELKLQVQDEARRQDRSRAWIVIAALKAYLSSKVAK